MGSLKTQWLTGLSFSDFGAKIQTSVIDTLKIIGGWPTLGPHFWDWVLMGSLKTRQFTHLNFLDFGAKIQTSVIDTLKIIGGQPTFGPHFWD